MSLFGSWWKSFVTDFGETGSNLVIIGVRESFETELYEEGVEMPVLLELILPGFSESQLRL